MSRDPGELEQVDAYRKIVRWARRTITSPGSANPHHRADDWLNDTLSSLMAEPAPTGKHEETGFEARNGKLQAICGCGYRTGWYEHASTVASAMSNHIFQRRS